MRGLLACSCQVAALLIGCGGTAGTTPSQPPASGAAGAAAAGAAAAGAAAAGAAGSHGGETSSQGGSPMAGGSAGQGGASGEATGGAGGACAAKDLDGLSVFSSGSWDPLGYPPYALDGCTLVYVAPTDGGGALHLRNLASGEDRELEPAAAKPRRPAVSGDVIAWETGDGATSQVRVSYLGNTQTLSGDFDHAGEPRVAGDAVVFTGFKGPNVHDDTDVYLYDVVKEALSPLAPGPGQQRFADVSLTHVAITDFSEDPRGYFDERDSIADVLILERQSGVLTPRKRPGKQAFPLLGSDGALVYLDWGAVHPEPKFSQFGLRAGLVDAPLDADYAISAEDIHTDPAYVRPSLKGVHVDFVDTRAGAIGLYRFTLGRDQVPMPTPIVGAPRLFGPVATDAMTLLAKPLDGLTLALTALAR